MLAAMKDNFVSTRHGRIHFVEAGNGAPLLLLHSNGCSHHEFDEVFDGLARHYRCIAWDMPGHGDSEAPAGHLSVADYADAVLAFMDALGIPEFHVSGASIGGLICIALSVRAPERILSTVIVEAVLRTAAEWAAQWPRIEVSFGLSQQSLDEVKPRFRDVTPALLQRWNIDRHKAGAWRMIDVMWAIRQYDALAELRRVDVRAAVIIGDQGPVFAGKHLYERLLPSAPLVVLNHCGHFPMIDDPAAFTAAMRDALGASVA